MRRDGRQADELRSLTIERRYTRTAPGSVLVAMGGTRVLCTACVEPGVPEFLLGSGKGWLTAEYSMLPGCTSPRKPRDRGARPDGRAIEIQRLIGRALRNVVRLDKIGDHTIWIDCDVLDADGGTRTASITGAFVALIDAMAKSPLRDALPAIVADSVAAVSVGIVAGNVVLDLDYHEDKSADVDMNLVMTGSGRFIEIQGTGENASFGEDQLATMLKLGQSGIAQLTLCQRTTLESDWPFIF